jgi:sugar lactone lactonase YvrE
VIGVPNFAKVRVTGVYPGIDLIYYGNQTRLEYDFVVSPGADPQQIRMRFDGITSLHIDTVGNLVLSTTAGELTQERPVIYQMVDGVRRAIPGRFEVGARTTVAFRIDSYDRSIPLVIDPVLDYSSFLGGGNNDEGHAVAVDMNGYLYLTGTTFSTPQGDADVLIRKIATDGSGFVYNADIGGSGNDLGTGIAVDPSGSVYVGGMTQSQDFPLSNPAQDTNCGTNNAFVLRLDPTGTRLIFSTYWGGSGDDRGYAIALDNWGSVYMAGASNSVDFPTDDGALQTDNAGGLDCFVVKFDSQGDEFFSTLLGGGSDDEAFAIAVDAQGNSYITGQTHSDNYPQVHPTFQHSRHGGLDAFLTEISPDGLSLVFSTFAGGSKDDRGSGIVLDANRNAYVVGTTHSDDFPTTSGAYQKGYAGGNSDIFVLAYSANGKNMPKSLLFSTLLGSRGTDRGYGIAVDASNSIYITGDTDSSQYPVTPAAIQPNYRGGLDVVMSVLDATGSHLLYSTFLGGGRDDTGYGIALDVNAEGNVYLTGVTSSGDFPTTQNASQTMPGGASDAFFAQISLSDSSDTRCAPPSAFFLSPASADFEAAGTGTGSQSFSVTTACSKWSAVATVPWISVIGNSLGSGDGTVSFRVGQNSDTTSRTGHIEVGRITFTVNQAAAVQPTVFGTISTVAGNGSRGFGGDDGPAVASQLNNPGGVAVDSVGNLYFADTDNNRIRKVSPNGIISTVAGTGALGFGGDGAPAAVAEIASPAAVAVDATGNLYFTDTLNGRIRRVTPSGMITTVAGNGEFIEFSGDGGPATAAAIAADSIAVDGAGNLYISDGRNQRIREVTTDGIIRTIAGDGTVGFGGDGGPATSAHLSNPVAVAVDGAGNLYIAGLRKPSSTEGDSD